MDHNDTGADGWRNWSKGQVEASAMLSLAHRFDDIATGRDQVPRRPVRSTIREAIGDRDVLAYQDSMIERSGPLFHHFLASVPAVLEEMSRVGVALCRLAERRSARGDSRTFTFYEADGFDGTNGRTMAEHSGGRIRTLTSSPNKANMPWFVKYANPEVSAYFPESHFKLTAETLRERHDWGDFRSGFDVVYETAAFQFYGKDRRRQIDHISTLLKPGGLAFFLEKLSHPDRHEYERRESTKDRLHKALYFSAEEIERKRRQMLGQMRHGQVHFDELAACLAGRFAHVYLIWNSTNFYEFVASDDPGAIDDFLELSGTPYIPEEFLFDRPVVRRVDVPFRKGSP